MWASANALFSPHNELRSRFNINEKQQLESLEEKIEYLRGFLKVTEKKRNEHSEVMKLVMQIKDVVSEAGNIVRQFVVDSVKDDASYSLRDVKKEIKTLTDEVMQIYDHSMYGINGVGITELKHSSSGSGGIGGSGSSSGRHTSKLGEEKVVVGFEKEVETLIQRLDNKGVGLEIISIIGAAGGGKTTLAREVYEHPFTSHTFEIRAWVNVSQDYDYKTKKKELLIGILKSASPKKHENYEKSNEDQLGEEVHKCLMGSKYLIVMDDIWGIEAWNDIQRSFPREREGNKVLFTSRLVVQPDGVSCVPHYLAPLPNHSSWKLLTKKVFGMKGCPKELEGIGEQIAGKCQGLPLEIVAIAACCYCLPCYDFELTVGFDVIKLPHNIFKMVELRHLYTKGAVFKYHLSHISSKKAARNPSKLDSLQTLHPICPCKDCQSFLVRTPNLTKLGFRGELFSQDGVLKIPDLEFLKCLETLSLNNLGFSYKHIIPAGLKLPQTITRLTLKGTLLNWEELSILQTLPSLEVLKLLMSACEGQVWNANELEGFFQLKYLRFEWLNIVEWNASEDQFPRLEVLVMICCTSLKQIPIDFANLKELRMIKLDFCSQSAEDSAREIQEEQRNKKGDDDCLHLLSTVYRRRRQMDSSPH
ncbi:hypothetical protein Vadar_023418 [Vaccinium darrowii]|uniref:Uncharacterized protein n=1 Tax=Vaccinium darrowii TaxID=229202 RepID=A0ACB7Y206_9ERIC|nr:hypothetical protein Vadar_023418 [Vaccinium darrowii]